MPKESTSKAKEGLDEDKSRRERLLIYLSIVAFIIILAIISTFYVYTNPIQQCKNVIIYSNKVSCFSNLAYSTGNASICSYLSGSYAASCYQSVAYKLSNASICKYAISAYEPIGASCIEYFVNKTGNISLCNSLPYNDKQTCAFFGALNSQNLSACELAGPNMSLCFSSVSLSRAIYYKDIFYCYNVSASTNKTFISDIISYSKAKPNSTIMGISFSFIPAGYNITARDLCILSVAQELGNKSYCSMLNYSIMQSACYQLVSPVQPSSSETNYTSLLQACSNAGSFANTCRTLVLISEAVSNKDVNICKTLNQTASWQCFTTLARTYKNISYCGYITNATVNNACILSAKYNVTS